MNKKYSTEPIPWVHKPSNLVSSWLWETEHFIVNIFAEGLNTRPIYNWKISDKSSGYARIFETGADMSFNDATSSILEVIGKSYPRVLGYQAYTGALAATFTISTGKKHDFSNIIGETVVVKVLNSDNDEIIITGVFDIQNYDFTITNGDSVLLVPPTRVVDVLKEYGMLSLINVQSESDAATRSKSGRIVHEEWRKGCTGKPGFRPGTTNHPPGTDYCSIHHI